MLVIILKQEASQYCDIHTSWYLFQRFKWLL